MAFLFGKKTPKPQSIGVSPTAPGNAEAAAEREAASRRALADSASAGRRSTIVAGMKIAMDEQAGVGLLSQKRRAEVRGV